MSNSDGTPSRSKPAMFNAGLFSTPVTSSNNTGSDLSSLGGFGDDIFTSGSPFSLAPAKPVQSLSTPDSTTLSKATEKPPASGLFASLSSSSTPSLFSSEGGGDSSEGLSTIPLDTPPHSQTKPIINAASVQSNIIQPGSKHGWNDPPFLSSLPQGTQVTQPAPQEPVLPGNDNTEPVGSDTYQIQPLVDRRSESPSVSSTGSQPPVGTAGANPYRLGGKKPVINMMPAYTQPGSTPSSSVGTSYHSTSYPGGLPPPPTSSQALPNYSGAPPSHSSAPPTSSTQLGGGIGIGSGQPSVGTVQPHWFYLKNNAKYWFPFNVLDSFKLDEAYLRCQADSSFRPVVHTDGGRYDVDVYNRVRNCVYWEESPSPVRRCTWFYRGENDQWYIPYAEDIADKLEEAYCSTCVSGRWNSKVDLSEGEGVIIHSSTSIVHYPPQHFQPLNHELDYSTKTVLRGFLERDKVDIGDDRAVDHVVFVVNGIGPFADIRNNSFKSLVDSVDDFREVALLMLKTHKFGGRMVTNRRVEFLPVNWYSSLQDDSTVIDEIVQSLSLPSILRLREFTNSSLVDILFYTSPMYQQAILNQVALEMNRMLGIFQSRNPGFTGGVSVMGHSLGSVILFDLLCHQNDSNVEASASINGVLSSDTNTPLENGLEGDTQYNESINEEDPPQLGDILIKLGLESMIDTFSKEQIDFDSLLMLSNEDLKEIGVPMGPRKKLSGFIIEWNQIKQIEEERKARVRDENERRKLEQENKKKMEELEKEQGTERVKFVKGLGGTGTPLVNYPKLNFNPSSFFAVGSPIGLFVTIRGVDDLGGEYQLPTCPSFCNIFHPYDPMAYRVEPLVVSPAPVRPVLMPHHKGRKRFHLELYENLEKVGSSVKHHIVEGVRNMWNQLNELARAHATPIAGMTKEEEQEIAQAELASQISEDVPDIQVPIGVLNGGDRIDYVLQEKPIEKLNDYLFALSSHLGYWHSEDTALFLLKQIYSNISDKPIR